MPKAKRTVQKDDSVFLKRFKILVGETTSQEEIAKKIRVSRQNVGYFLSGHTMPNCDTISKIAIAYGVSVDWLLGISDTKTPDANIKAVCEYTGLSETAMENFKQIDKCKVWGRLQAGKTVYAVILKSKNFREGIFDLRKDWSVGQINRLLSDKEKNVEFYEEIEVQK